MNKNIVMKVLPIGLLAMAIIFVLSILVLRWLWGWIIPDLFPEAVAQGLIVDTLSWTTSLKLAVAFILANVVLGLFSSGKD